MASIVSQGKTSDPKIENVWYRQKCFRDRTDADVENRIRNIYVQVANKLKGINHPMPQWLIESLKK